MLDLVIRGGRVVTPAGAGEWDVGVQGEKIAAVATPGTLPTESARVIDARGKVVVPGGIEAHAHPTMVAGANATGYAGAAGTAEQSQAALWGGTTTILDFTVNPQEGDIVDAARKHLEAWKGQAYTDFSCHCSFRFNPSPVTTSQVKDLIAAGLPTIKTYTTLAHSNTDAKHCDLGNMQAIMEEVAKHGGIMSCHCEDDDIVRYNLARAKETKQDAWYNMHLVHSNLSEDVAFHRVLQLQKWTGAAVYFVHTSAKEGVNAIAEARGQGRPVYGETLLLYSSFNAEKYKEPDGMKYQNYPSLKYEDDRQRLWDGLIKGDLAVMATDSIAVTYAAKTAGKTVFDVPGGNIGIEVRMGITYGDGVVKQGMSLERYAAVTSTNVAKIHGLYPRKGAIGPGSDADITIIDPSVKKRLSLRDLHLRDYSPWEGWEVNGWPATVLLRGKVVLENGRMTGKPTDGQFIARKIDPAVLKRPMC